MCGSTWSNDGDVTGNHSSGWDYWVVKISATGVLQWEKSLGGTEFDFGETVHQTADGGYIVAGCAMSNDGDVTGNHSGRGDYWIVKLSPAGIIEWKKCFGGSGDEGANCIIQTTDGGYIVGGSANSIDGDVTGIHGQSDAWIVKLSATGSIQWQKCYGGPGNEEAWAIRQTQDGGYIFGGYNDANGGDVTGNHGNTDVWVVKISDTGALQWQKSYGGSGYEGLTELLQAGDGGYIFSAGTASLDGDVSGNHGDNDMWIVKLSDTGSIEWQRCYGGTAFDNSGSMAAARDSGYILAGSAESSDGDVTFNHGWGDYWVVKISKTGSIQWQHSYGSTAGDAAYAVCQAADGDYVVVGSDGGLLNGDVTSTHGTGDYWMLKIGVVGDGDPTLGVPVAGNGTICIGPDPTSGQLRITGIEQARIRVDNLAGTLVKEALNATEINISDCPSGVYLVSLWNSNGNKLYQQRVVKN